MKLSTASLRAALAALALAATGAALAMAGPMGGHRGHAEMAGPGPDGAPRMGGPMMDGPMRGRLLDAVKATPEQKQRIQAIQEAARDDLRKLHEGDRTLREQMMAALAAPTIDTARIEALRKQQLARHDQASQRMQLAMIDAAKVLTPEQRTQLAERAQQRRDLMERHRRERQALEPAAPAAPSR